jgi:CheY-like chemotaxis protein
MGSVEKKSRTTLFAAYLTKPVKPSQLRDTLVSVITGESKPAQQFASPRIYTEEIGKNHPLRLLVAEDNEVNQKLIQIILKRLGYRPDIVANGQEALDALARQPYDVILMDVQMPEMDGITATYQIRTQFPPERQPHIVAMTANALQGDRERYLAAGMDDYVSKPLKIDDLVRALLASQTLTDRPETSSETQAAETKPSPDDAGTAVDATVLAEFSTSMGDDGPELVSGLVALYLKDSPRLVQAMRDSFNEKDSDCLRRSAHTLKGTVTS